MVSREEISDKIDVFVKKYSKDFSNTEIIPEYYINTIDSYVELIGFHIRNFLNPYLDVSSTKYYGEGKISPDVFNEIRKKFKIAVKGAESTKEWECYNQKLESEFRNKTMCGE